ncbi:MAG: hypothetical protein V4440_10315 [Pseudomonadota bacterium]
MAKADVVAAAVAAVQQGEAQVLADQFGSVFDQAEAQGTGPGFTQADIDAAVASAQGIDAQALADAKAASDAAMATLQAQLDDATAKKNADESVIAGLQSSADKLQAAVDLIHSLFPVAPSA